MIANDPGVIPRKNRLGRALTSPVAWTVTAAVMAALLSGGGGASSLSCLLFVMFAAYVALWYLATRRRLRERLHLRGWVAVAVYLGIGLTGGVVYELTLAAGGSGYGGLHEDTATSFLLLPGYLVPAVVITLWMVRRYGLDARELFFVAGAMSWYEVLAMGMPALVGMPMVAPALVAFYVGSYALYNGAYGLLLIEPNQVWAEDIRRISGRRQILSGIAAGAVCWATFVVWAGVVGAA